MKHYILPVLGIALAIYACIGACEHSPPGIYTQECITEDSLLTTENLLSYIVEIDMDCPIIVLKQAILETSHFTSSVCRQNNNLFGLYTKTGYMKFKTWQESCRFYKDIQCRRYSGTDYYKWLKDIGWAEDPQYCEKLKHIRL